MVTKKTKKPLESINSRLPLVMKSGSTCWGTRDSEDDQRRQSEAGPLANNCPALRRPETDRYAVLAETGSVTTRAMILNWAQRVENTGVCTLAIIDPGDSGINRSMPEQTGEEEIMQNFSVIKLASPGWCGSAD